LAKEKLILLKKLSEYSEKEILQLHGFGKSTMQKLKAYMKENNVSFKIDMNTNCTNICIISL
jgi:2-iminoacetate synthase ThiH